ncbi:MAG TPA: hypothetical protein DCP31_37420 [Cyanobacteria bacterium UBA8543]|nr:hypothetical protein [Cyanobacteria bacterium UBA8543]
MCSCGFNRRILGRVFKPLDPPQPPLKRGENKFKVPLFKGDLGGSHRHKRSEMSLKTRPIAHTLQCNPSSFNKASTQAASISNKGGTGSML